MRPGGRSCNLQISGRTSFSADHTDEHCIAKHTASSSIGVVRTMHVCKLLLRQAAVVAVLTEHDDTPTPLCNLVGETMAIMLRPLSFGKVTLLRGAKAERRTGHAGVALFGRTPLSCLTPCPLLAGTP